MLLSSKISIFFSSISLFLIAMLILYGLSSAYTNDKYGLGGVMIAWLWIIAYFFTLISYLSYRYRVKRLDLEPSKLTINFFRAATLGIAVFFIVGWIAEA